MTESSESEPWNWDGLTKRAFQLFGTDYEMFWELTPSEFFLLSDAQQEEEERFWDGIQELAAWHAVHIMNASGNLKKPIKDHKSLIGNKGRNKTATKSSPKKMSPDDKRKELERLKERFGRTEGGGTGGIK